MGICGHYSHMERWIFSNFRVDQVFQVAKEQRVGCSMIAWSWMGVNILFNWFAQQKYVFCFFVFSFCFLFLFFKPIFFSIGLHSNKMFFVFVF